jgi:hypothetical protein
MTFLRFIRDNAFTRVTAISVMDFDMAHDVFISYAKKDQVTAETVCRVLEDGSVRVWIAPRDILAGANWVSSIPKAIEDARIIVLLYSANADVSEFVLREMNHAINCKKSIIPFCLSPINKSGALGFIVSTSHWLDAFPPPLAPHLKNLAATTKKYLGLRPQNEPSVRPSNTSSGIGKRPPEKLAIAGPRGDQPRTTNPSPSEASDTVATAPRRGKPIAIAAGAVLVVLGSAVLFSSVGNQNSQLLPDGHGGDATGNPNITVKPVEGALDTCRKSNSLSAFVEFNKVEGRPQVTRIDTLIVQDQSIRLAGVGIEKRGDATKILDAWLKRHSQTTVSCVPITYCPSSYRCDVEGQDVAKYILAHELASPSSDQSNSAVKN